MKRDWNLIRKIMIKIEESDGSIPFPFSVDGHTAKEVDYHIDLLKDAHLVETNPQRNDLELTNQGRDF